MEIIREYVIPWVFYIVLALVIGRFLSKGGG